MNKWSIYTLAIVLFITLPIGAIVLQLIDGPGESWGHIVKNVLADYLLNSLWLIIGCTLITSLFGVFSAWIVSRYTFPLQRSIEWLLILPLALPSYITAYAYSGFLDYGGTLAKAFKAIGGSYQKIDIMNLGGLIFVLSISLFPYVYIASRAVFIYQSGRLIEAAKLSGNSEKKTFFKIVLPMARPAIVGGLLLVVMEVLNDYGAAHYFGISTFTTGIFRTWFSLEEPATAMYLCAILLIIVFAFVTIERWQRKNKKYYLASKSDIVLPKLVTSKRQQMVLLLLLSIPILLGFVIPVGQLLYWSVLTFEDVASSNLLGIGMESLGIALLSGTLTVLFALMLLYFPRWNRFSFLKNSSRIATIGYAIPGAVLAIGIMIPSLYFDKWIAKTAKELFGMDTGLLLNGGLMLLLYAYIARFLAVAFHPMAASQEKIGPTLSEASRSLGKNNLKTFWKVDLPLLKPALLSAFILVFVDTMKELPLTLILKPYQIETLALKAYEFASDEQVLEASLPSLFIIAIGVLPVIFLNRLILNRDNTKGKIRHKHS